jgi:hypothetical protein
MFTPRNIGLLLLVVFFTTTMTLWVQAQQAAPDADAEQVEPADVAGTWTYTVQGRNGEVSVTITLEQDGDQLTGTVSGFGGQDNPIEEGKVVGNTVTFKTAAGGGGGGGGQARPAVNVYTCTLENGALVGKIETIRTREFQATRGGEGDSEPAAAPGA